GMRAVISGSGNVATHAAEKLIHLGAKPVTLSDSGGFIHDPEGLTLEKVQWVKSHKTHRRGRISEYAEEFKGATFHPGEPPWSVRGDVAVRGAARGELLGAGARTLVANGCIAVSEGANMPCDLEAAHYFRGAKTMFGPGKAANAGGVAVSGLEMSQNSSR